MLRRAFCIQSLDTRPRSVSPNLCQLSRELGQLSVHVPAQKSADKLSYPLFASNIRYFTFRMVMYRMIKTRQIYRNKALTSSYHSLVF